MTRGLRFSLTALAALFAAIIVLGGPARPAEGDKGVLADLISRALSTPTTSVSIGAVDGVLSSDASISDIVLSDRKGPWLKIDKVRLVWNRFALLSRRLEVDQLTVDHLQFLRRPLPPETAPPPDTSGPQPILPELPVKVIVKALAIEEVSLGEPVIGVAARLAVSGKVTLGPAAEGLDLTLTSKRLDAPGEFSALLTYVPATDQLSLNVNSAEPAGGLFAHLVNLPGLPPVRLSLDGAGPLDNFSAKLDFAAGPDVWANGQVIVARQGAGRRLTLQMKAQLEGLAPEVVRPVFAGQTTLDGAIVFNDDAIVAVPGLHVVTGSARLDISGRTTADNGLDFKVAASAAPGATAVKKLDLNASLAGPLAAPRIEGALDAEEIRVEQGSIGRITATFHANPNGALTDAATRILFAGEGAVQGLAPANPALRQAFGGDFNLTLSGSAAGGGEVNFDVLDLEAPSFEARYAGLLSRRLVHGRLDITAGDLSRFALLAGGALKGAARIRADLDGAPRYGALTANIDARLSKLATPWPILDRVTGGAVSVTGLARLTPGGGFGFSDLRATGLHGSAALTGDYAPDKVNLGARIDVPDAQVLDPRIGGKVEALAALSGAPDDLDANLKATLSDGRLLDRKTSGLTLEAQARHAAGLVDANAALTGDVDGKPLKASAHVGSHADGGWVVDNLGLSLASARLSGALAIGAAGLADGSLTFSAANLDDLSPLVLTRLSGALAAKATVSSAGGLQSVAISADSASMSVGANRLQGLKLDLTIGDLWGARNISGTMALARAEVAGQSLADVRLTATGGVESSDLDLSASVRGFAVKARGRLAGGPPVRFELESLAAVGAGRRITLARPASLTFAGDGVDIADFALAVDAGRLAFSGHAGSTLDLKASATALPLAALDLVRPGLGLSGVADGEATIAGTPADPSGEWRLRLKQASLPALGNAALPALDVDGRGRLAAGRTSLDLAVSAGVGNAMRVTGSAPLSAEGALDVRIDGKLDLGVLNNMLSVTGRRATGALALALQLRGTLARPEAQGSIRLSAGAVSDDQTGFKVSGLTGLVTVNGATLRIDRLEGTTPNGGQIAATGEVRLDPAAGFPGSLRLTGQRAQLVNNDVVVGSADLALTISGPLAEKPNLAGRITIESMEITVPSRFSSDVQPIPGTRHLNPTPTARARLALLARARAAGAGAPLFDAMLALTVAAPNAIFIRGRGIDAALSGELRLSGSLRDPKAAGGFSLLRGTLSILGRQLAFTRGRVWFRGDIMPELDLVAETTAADITARISVEGPASQPSISISSTPNLPQDEILSRVLFQQPSGSLSGFQALELANAAATLAGDGGALERLRRSFGLGSLNLGASTTGGGPLLGLGRAINDRIGVNVTTGARPEDNSVNVDLNVSPHIRLEAGVDATGGTSAGVGAQWEFK